MTEASKTIRIASTTDNSHILSTTSNHSVNSLCHCKLLEQKKQSSFSLNTNIWPEAKPNDLRPLWKGHPRDVGQICCYPSTLFQCRDDITWEKELPLTEAILSHLHSSLYIRKTADFLGGMDQGDAMEETAAFLSLCKWLCSADHRFEHDPELRAQQTTHLAAATSSTTHWKASREPAYPTWLRSQPLNHLLPSPTAGFRFCCWADLLSMVLTGLYKNESKPGSSLQGCLYAKKGMET